MKPLDGVVPYRLEMQAKAAVSGHKNLYDFWGHSLYQEVMDNSRILINLASKEYSKCIEKYLRPEDRSSIDEYVFIRTEIPGKSSRR